MSLFVSKKLGNRFLALQLQLEVLNYTRASDELQK